VPTPCPHPPEIPGVHQGCPEQTCRGRIASLTCANSCRGSALATAVEGAAGDCWCGCEDATTPGNFFSPGHDKVAESAVINLKYGSVAEFLVEHGFGPGGKTPRLELDEWRRRGGHTR